MRQISGVFPLSFAIKIYSISFWNIVQCESLCFFFFSTDEDHNSYPSHSLLRFLLVSNSLDLIIDVVLELWNAVIGEFISSS